jgi:AraC family transcriptional regulator
MHLTLATGRYLGRVVRQRDSDGIVLTETSYAPRAVLPEHSHATPTFFLALCGSFSVQAGGQSFACGAWGASFHNAEAMHAVGLESANGRGLNVALPAGWTANFAGASEALAGTLAARSLLPHLLSRLYGELRESDEVSDIAIQGLCLELVAATRRTAAPNGRRRLPAVTRTLELLRDSGRPGAELFAEAREAGVAPEDLAAAVRAGTGRSVGSLARLGRIRKACARLATGRETLGAIAADLGFYDQSHFTRTFKVVTGMTPSEYRRHHRCG